MENDLALTGAQLLAIYRLAIRIRLNDERVIKEMMAGRLVTPYYSA